MAILLEDSASPARLLVRLPPALRQWPEGLGQLQEILPEELAWVDPALWGFRLAVLLSLLGLWTEWSLLGAALLGALVLPLAQLVGPTVHNHHLFWFLLLLASARSSSAAVWSMDAWRRGGRSSRADVERAEVAVCFGRALLGLVYFFPGFWKLRSSGLGWFEPEALVHLFHSKWYQFDLLPWLRIDRYPRLLGLGALGIVLLELSFPFLVATGRGRSLALGLGLGFHVLSAQLLGIAFAPLWLCYGLLVDWRRVDAWLRSERPRQARARPFRPWPALGRSPALTGIGLLAVVGSGVQGLRGQSQSWPWACYPTFQWIVPAEQLDVLAVTHDSEPPGAFPSPAQARRRSQREWGQMYRLLGAYGGTRAALDDARCAYARLLLAERKLPRNLGRSTQVDLYLVARSTVPEAWNDEPRTLRRLARCSVP